MKTLVIAVVALFGLAGFAPTFAAEKIDAAKLVGTWKLVKSGDGPVGSLIELTKDGKMKVTIDMNGKKLSIDGTYKLDGDKLEIKLAFGGEEKKEVITITKLTDTDFVTVDSKNMTDEFKREGK